MVVVIQLLSGLWLFATPWTAWHQASLSFSISLSLLKLMSIESVMPSSYFILCRALLLLPTIFPSIRVFSSESALHIRWPKYWSFIISPSNEYSGLISFRIDWFYLSLHSKGLSRLFSSAIFQKHQFFGTQPSLWFNSLMAPLIFEHLIAFGTRRYSRLTCALSPAWISHIFKDL